MSVGTQRVSTYTTLLGFIRQRQISYLKLVDYSPPRSSGFSDTKGWAQADFLAFDAIRRPYLVYIRDLQLSYLA